jgi:hypothetical protein
MFVVTMAIAAYINGERNNERRSISSKYENKSAPASDLVVCIIVPVTIILRFNCTIVLCVALSEGYTAIHPR